ncbi:PhlD [Streptomyces tsukubensis]|uniref:PhlD n=1 Tax=Streptomyces tsukubensis TaxID=83656 RepID=UPI0021177A9A|nr:PhlD [Streptomyces tsukubensis]
MANIGVETRYFSRALGSGTVSGDKGIADRAGGAFLDALDMAEDAARGTLERHGLEAGDITAVITTHSTGWAIPNLDIHLIDRLELPSTVRRIALTTTACAGGVQALIRAVDLITARPGARVLVVAAEVLSTLYNHQDTAVEHMIYKALFGDSAAATIVTDTPLGSGLSVEGPEDTYEHVLPRSLDWYDGHMDEAGIHFNSTKAALTAADGVLPDLGEWLGADAKTEWGVIHPGSRRIIQDTATALGLGEDDTRHSVTTLATEGNLGAVSVLRILERTHQDPPREESTGVMVAYGPGFATAALRGTWRG